MNYYRLITGDETGHFEYHLMHEKQFTEPQFIKCCAESYLWAYENKEGTHYLDSDMGRLTELAVQGLINQGFKKIKFQCSLFAYDGLPADDDRDDSKRPAIVNKFVRQVRKGIIAKHGRPKLTRKQQSDLEIEEWRKESEAS